MKSSATWTKVSTGYSPHGVQSINYAPVDNGQKWYAGVACRDLYCFHDAMPRTPARCTEADINRAAKVAMRHGMAVAILPDGTIRLEPLDSTKQGEPFVDEYAGVGL